MNKTNKFSPEVRERAVRMLQEHRGEYPSLSEPAVADGWRQAGDCGSVLAGLSL